MSRNVARKSITLEQHVAALPGVECRVDADVLDESPAAYKSIDAVMAAQTDLTEPVHAIKQIIVNLLSNAVKFTPDGGRVVVRSRVLRDSIVLMIGDSGIGIAPQSLARLGRPFEQVESQLTKTYHGSGLGLAIARSLAHLHGGSMRLRSKLGTGTVVCVLLPRDARKAKAKISVAA